MCVCSFQYISRLPLCNGVQISVLSIHYFYLENGILQSFGPLINFCYHFSCYLSVPLVIVPVYNCHDLCIGLYTLCMFFHSMNISVLFIRLSSIFWFQVS
jgi:hypothetical protein